MINFPSIDKFDLIIGTGVTFNGDIRVDGRVSVSGQVKGSVQARDLRVEVGGRVDGQVHASVTTVTAAPTPSSRIVVTGPTGPTGR